MSAQYQMQARSSTDGQLYTWITASADFAGSSFPGPGVAEHVAIASRIDTDASGGTTSIGTPVADIAALRALGAVVDGQQRQIKGTAKVFAYSALTGAGFADDANTCILPTGILVGAAGRWYPVGGAAVVPTFAAARLCDVIKFPTITIQARSTLGDGGGGVFHDVTGVLANVDDDGIFLHAGSRIIQRAWDGHHVSIAWFGAKADYNQGSDTGTDNGPAIQAAFNALKATGGHVFVPPGKYAVATPIFVSAVTGGSPFTRNVSLIGLDPTTTVLWWTGTGAVTRASGTATAHTSGSITDAGASFIAAGVTVGDRIRFSSHSDTSSVHVAARTATGITLSNSVTFDDNPAYSIESDVDMFWFERMTDTQIRNIGFATQKTDNTVRFVRATDTYNFRFMNVRGSTVCQHNRVCHFMVENMTDGLVPPRGQCHFQDVVSTNSVGISGYNTAVGGAGIYLKGTAANAVYSATFSGSGNIEESYDGIRLEWTFITSISGSWLVSSTGAAGAAIHLTSAVAAMISGILCSSDSNKHVIVDANSRDNLFMQVQGDNPASWYTGVTDLGSRTVWLQAGTRGFPTIIPDLTDWHAYIFGAKNDSGTDDYAILQAALTTLAAAGGGELILQHGLGYALSDTLAIPTGVFIRGTREGTILYPGVGKPALRFDSVTNAGASGLTIRANQSHAIEFKCTSADCQFNTIRDIRVYHLDGAGSANCSILLDAAATANAIGFPVIEDVSLDGLTCTGASGIKTTGSSSGFTQALRVLSGKIQNYKYGLDFAKNHGTIVQGTALVTMTDGAGGGRAVYYRGTAQRCDVNVNLFAGTYDKACEFLSGAQWNRFYAPLGDDALAMVANNSGNGTNAWAGFDASATAFDHFPSSAQFAGGVTQFGAPAITSQPARPGQINDTTGGVADGALVAIGATNTGDRSGDINNNFADIAARFNALELLVKNSGMCG